MLKSTPLSISITIAVLVILASCKENNRASNNDLKIPSLKNDTLAGKAKILTDIFPKAWDGDAAAYSEVALYYQVSMQDYDLFYTSLHVADRYNNPEACWNVYQTLMLNKGDDRIQILNEMNPMTRNLALYNLLKAYELGYPIDEEVHHIFRDQKNIPKTSDFICYKPI